MSRIIGKIAQKNKFIKEVEWEIENIFSLPKEVDTYYEGPRFEFLECKWYLRLYPNGQTWNNSTKHINVYIMKESSDPPLRVTYSLSLKAPKGTPDYMRHGTAVFETTWGHPQFLTKSELMRRRTELAPSDVLTIICSLEQYDPNTFRRTEKLLTDFKILMNEKRHSDVTVKVKGETFELHRSILQARTPVFDAMFKHDMKEKKTGVVTIRDCKPTTFRLFLEYVYTGTVTLSADNAFDLHELADKYQVDELKEDCCHYIGNTLTVDTFCDAMALAIRHDKKELIEAAAQLLSQKMIDIMKTVKWMKFMKENAIQANEVTLKALAIKEKKN